MADDFQVTRSGRPDLDATPALRRPAIAPDDPEAARAEIEATRARMSETIDEIEDVLLAKKDRIRDQLDVLAPVRENPVKTLGMIFGAALVLGLLTGGGTNGSRDEDEDVLLRTGGDDEEDEEEEDEEALAWQRAEEWEDRAHRLLRIARAQEDELEIHRARRDTPRGRLRARHEDDEDYEDYEDDTSEPNIFERIRETAAERLAVLAGEISHRMMRGG